MQRCCRGGYYPPEMRALAGTGRLIAAPTEVFVSKKVGGKFDVRRAGVVPPYGDFPTGGFAGGAPRLSRPTVPTQNNSQRSGSGGGGKSPYGKQP